MVDEPVDHRSGDNLITEHFTPAAEGFAGGDDQAGALIAGGPVGRTCWLPRFLLATHSNGLA